MALLFDLDGTLIDSEDAHKAAEVETFLSLGYEFTQEELLGFTGVPYRAMLARIAPNLSLDTFFGAHKERLLALVGTRIVPFNDVEDCLALARTDASMIVTSSPRWYVENVLDTFPALRLAFKGVICADDVVNGKPDPEAFIAGAAALGLPPSECTAIEDSPNGISSAKAAGCYTIAIRRDPRLDLSQADAVITSLAELADVA
jgi:HAD superfamily hydrolase (TIGR01509 family)